MKRLNAHVLMDRIRALVLGFFVSLPLWLVWSPMAWPTLKSAGPYLVSAVLGRHNSPTISMVIAATETVIVAGASWHDRAVFGALWIASSITIFWFFDWAAKAQKKEKT